MRKENPITLHLQYSSLLDSTVFKTVSRLTDQLRDLYYSDKVRLDGPQTIGDIIPTIREKKVIELKYEVLNESNVESIINRVNFDIFGDSLVEIPAPNNTYSIFIACHLDTKIENNIDYS